MLAINIALTKAPGTIYIIGGGGGRTDHLLSNIFMLENLKNRGINAFMSATFEGGRHTQRVEKIEN